MGRMLTKKQLVGAGFDQPPLPPHLADVDDQIYWAWRTYLEESLGRSEEHAHERAMLDVTRERARRLVASWVEKGWVKAGARVLDVGSGHGTLAVELALVGADVTALEPCSPWREVSQRRADAMGLRIEHFGDRAEEMPFPSESFDFVVSLQVLEHVKEPPAVIREMARVLRVGGRYFVSCENYLAFREQHYAVPWLPLLPKPLGGVYLRSLGKNPRFLLDHVTYVTWPRLAWWFATSGLAPDGWYDGEACQLGARGHLVSRALRPFLGIEKSQLVAKIVQMRGQWFRVGFYAEGAREPCSRDSGHRGACA